MSRFAVAAVATFVPGDGDHLPAVAGVPVKGRVGGGWGQLAEIQETFATPWMRKRASDSNRAKNNDLQDNSCSGTFSQTMVSENYQDLTSRSRDSTRS